MVMVGAKGILLLTGCLFTRFRQHVSSPCWAQIEIYALSGVSPDSDTNSGHRVIKRQAMADIITELKVFQ